MTGSESPIAQFGWLVTTFTERVPGVAHAIVVSTDGLLLTSSARLPQDRADRLAAAACGLLSLAQGAARVFDAGRVRETVVQMDGGLLNMKRCAGMCEVAVDRGIGPMQPTGAAMEAAAIIAAVRILASSAGLSLHRDAPFLTMTMANGFRLHAVLPPSSDGTDGLSPRWRSRSTRDMESFPPRDLPSSTKV